MSEPSFLRVAGWSALFNGVLTIAITLTLILLFTAGGFWGQLNDSISVVWVLTFLPLVWVFHQMHRPFAATVSLAAALAAGAAVLTFAALQSLLAQGSVTFEQAIGTVVALGAVIGLWLLVNGLISLVALSLPATLAWLTVIFGAGYVLSALGFALGGQQHPLSVIGYLVGTVAGAVWAFWLGRLLLNRDPSLRLALRGAS